MGLSGVHSRRAVCFLDVLGFRRMLEQKPVIEIAQDYDRFISFAEGFNQPWVHYKDEPKLFNSHSAGEPYCIRQNFSDSLILIAKDDDPLSCLKLLVHAWRLIQSALALRISIRGAVVCGEMYFDLSKGICLGHGLTAAYELEQKQNWVGVAIDSSIETTYPEIFPEGPSENSILNSLFLKYPVPLKDGSFLETRTLNWRLNLVVQKGTKWLFPDTQDESGLEKIQNTLAYAGNVIKSGCVYVTDQGACPIELRAFWIGDCEPPFPHGDEL